MTGLSGHGSSFLPDPAAPQQIRSRRGSGNPSCRRVYHYFFLYPEIMVTQKHTTVSQAKVLWIFISVLPFFPSDTFCLYSIHLHTI